MKTRNWLIVIGGLCLGGCIGLAAVLSYLAFLSWNTTEGIVTISFNLYHERLLECILFPLWTIGGLVFSVYLIKHLKR